MEEAVITFSRGITEQVFTVSILSDNVNEPTEGFDLCLEVIEGEETVIGMHNVTTVVIRDNDGEINMMRVHTRMCVCLCVCVFV